MNDIDQARLDTELADFEEQRDFDQGRPKAVSKPEMAKNSRDLCVQLTGVCPEMYTLGTPARAKVQAQLDKDTAKIEDYEEVRCNACDHAKQHKGPYVMIHKQMWKQMKERAGKAEKERLRTTEAFQMYAEKMDETVATLRKAKEKAEHDLKALKAPMYKVNAPCTLGVGDGGGELYVHGDYDSIKACQKTILEAAELRRVLDELNRKITESPGHTGNALVDARNAEATLLACGMILHAAIVTQD